MLHPIAVRLQISEVVNALEEASVMLAGPLRARCPGDPGPDDGEFASHLAPIVLRAYGNALQVAAYLREGCLMATDPGM